MNDDEKKDDDDKYQGVPIQKLPTIGRPYSEKTWKMKESYTSTMVKLRSKKGKKLLKIARILSQKDT